jgi:XTP/dITP diphosphohydrolase
LESSTSDPSRDPSPTRLVIATTNLEKLREIRLILAGLSVEVVALQGYPGIVEPDERGTSFAENARAKAVYYAEATGQTVVAEDSGLEVHELDGARGVHSARYGGPSAVTYADKFNLIYAGLRSRGKTTSPARFVCALALARAGRILFETRGVVEGTIAPEPRGEGGFGYDPIFYYPPYGRTLAEVSAARKAAVSHRGQAFRALRGYLGERLVVSNEDVRS